MKSGLFLFIYSILKAFLPLPSIEAVLLPMCLIYPDLSFIYALLSGVGTCIGGHIGYELGYVYGRRVISRFVHEQTLDEGVESFKRHGSLAVVLGSISPFPDFVLAYLAGIMKMNKWLFMLLDGGCRFLRSIVLIYFSAVLNQYFHVEKWIMIFSILLLVYFLGNIMMKKVTK